MAQLAALGGERVDIDFAPFQEAGSLLYEGPFVAERLEAAGALLAENPAAIVAPVRTIMEGAARFDARAAFAAQHRLARLRREAGRLLAGVDFLFVPTTPTIYPIAEVEASPLALNGRLGAYVNFVNLLDLCALAVPLGFRAQGADCPACRRARRWSRRGGATPRWPRSRPRCTGRRRRRMGATGAPLPAAVEPAAAPSRLADARGRSARTCPGSR